MWVFWCEIRLKIHSNLWWGNLFHVSVGIPEILLRIRTSYVIFRCRINLWRLMLLWVKGIPRGLFLLFLIRCWTYSSINSGRSGGSSKTMTTRVWKRSLHNSKDSKTRKMLISWPKLWEKSRRQRSFCMTASKNCWRGRGIWTNWWRRAKIYQRGPSSSTRHQRRWTNHVVNWFEPSLFYNYAVGIVSTWPFFRWVHRKDERLWGGSQC